MNEQKLDNLAEKKPLNGFDWIIEILMVSLLAFMPLAFGVVHAWSELVVIVLVGAMVLCLSVKLALDKDTRLVWTWAYVPLVLFLLLVVVQLLPLPASVVRAVSPNTYKTKTLLLEDLPPAVTMAEYATAGSVRLADVHDQMTLSFYPYATEHDLRLLLAISMVFIVVVNVYRRPAQIKRLLAAIMVIGFGIAGLALAQNTLGADKIYWVIPVPQAELFSGTFINHHHYGQFINLSIGAALGLILLRLHEAFINGRISLAGVIERIGELDLWIVWFGLSMIVLGIATLFLSFTRGGMISILIAGSFTALITGIKHGLKGNGLLIAVLLIGSFTCALYIGYDALHDQQSLMNDTDQGEVTIWSFVKNNTLVWTGFPGFGTGLGTHDVVNSMFDRSTTAFGVEHSENVFIKAIKETGVIGLGLLALVLVIVFNAYQKNLLSASESKSEMSVLWSSFGLGFGLLTVLVHSLIGFGEHLPVNTCLAAIFCGLLIAVEHKEKEIVSPNIRSHGNHPQLRKVFVILVVFVFGWAILGANAARSGEKEMRQARHLSENLGKNSRQVSHEKYDELLEYARAAINEQPKNVSYHHQLNVYRLHTPGQMAIAKTVELTQAPETVDSVRQIMEDLHYARRLCPTYGSLYSLIGQIEYFILEDPAGAERIRQGYKLAPSNAWSCFTAGLLDIRENKLEESVLKFSRAVELDDQFRDEVIDVYINQLNRPDLAVRFAEEDIDHLVLVAQRLNELSSVEELVVGARIRLAEILEEKCLGSDVRASAWAELAGINYCLEDYEGALENYNRALALDESHSQWHLALARTLMKLGRVEDALREARTALRLEPHMTAAEKLIGDLSLLLQEDAD